MKFKKTFKELNKQLKSWEDMEFPRIKQPKPQFPEVVENNFEPTDEQVDDFIHNVDRRLYV